MPKRTEDDWLWGLGDRNGSTSLLNDCRLCLLLSKRGKTTEGKRDMKSSDITHSRNRPTIHRPVWSKMQPMPPALLSPPLNLLFPKPTSRLFPKSLFPNVSQCLSDLLFPQGGARVASCSILAVATVLLSPTVTPALPQCCFQMSAF